MTVRIGTSGWVCKHWSTKFYPREIKVKDWFRFYANEFDTVEINNSFYRLPTVQSFEGWRKQAPKGFAYAVKASRYLTHMKKLKVSHCLHDMHGIDVPVRLTGTPVYVRFHGDQHHAGDYDDSVLRMWAERIGNWQADKHVVFVYFNIDVGGFAIKNARTLKQMLGLHQYIAGALTK